MMTVTEKIRTETPTHTEYAAGYAMHEVLNQPGTLADYDAYMDCKALVQAVKVFGANWANETIRRAGVHVGSEKVQCLARQANRHLPELKTHDRFGNRVDLVEFHPAYHELMGLIFGPIHSPGRIRTSPAHMSRAAR
jgi:putative acyl-CoA dehydrogenase